MELNTHRKLLKAVSNAIQEYLNTTAFGWIGISGYSGEYGQKRALDFQQRLSIMADLHILEKCLKVFVESTVLKRHIIDHLVMSGIWYNKLTEKMSNGTLKDDAIREIIDTEIDFMTTNELLYLNNNIVV